MSMTKTDYELIAKVLHNCLDTERNLTSVDTVESVKAIECVAVRLSIHLALDNERFDSDRFLTACGITKG